jgi:fermentation-respiration switch protein FrsA (DUF1100 family)
MPDILMSIGRIALATYLGLMLLLYLRQAKYIYYPSRALSLNPSTAGLTYEDLSLATLDGETIHGWFVPAEKATATVLVCHGNAGNIWNRIGVIWLIHDMGFNVCVFDYRGYGKSTGNPTEAGTYHDAETVWAYLENEKKLPAGRIVVWGESLGGAVAAWLAEQKKPGALVLESTFTSLPDMAARFYPFMPVRWLCRFRYNTLERMGGIKCPVLVAHSANDEMIPFQQAQRLFMAAREPKRFVTMQGSHNAGREATAHDFEAQVKAFLLEHLKP